MTALKKNTLSSFVHTTHHSLPGTGVELIGLVGGRCGIVSCGSLSGFSMSISPWLSACKSGLK